MRRYVKVGNALLLISIVLLAIANGVNLFMVIGAMLFSVGSTLNIVARGSDNKRHGIRLSAGETICIVMPGQDEGVAVIANPNGLSAHPYPVDR